MLMTADTYSFYVYLNVRFTILLYCCNNYLVLECVSISNKYLLASTSLFGALRVNGLKLGHFISKELTSKL